MGKDSDIITQNLGPVDQQGVNKGKCSQGNTITLAPIFTGPFFVETRGYK